MTETAYHLSETIKLALPLLRSITNEQASTRPAPGKWSPKEIIGHLIDSAGNNQQKFVRCMEQANTHMPPYAQDFWVTAQRYNDEPWDQLLLSWENFNQHLAHIMTFIPEASLTNTIIIGNSGPFTLEFIVKDYPEHLKHHLKSLFPQAGFLNNSFNMVY